MRFRVLLADDTEVMRKAIASMLYEEPNIEVVGEAANFSQAVQMVADLKPQVLVLDLHLAKMELFPPALVKAQFSTVDHVLAISFATDGESRRLAQNYGAAVLLNKMHLYRDLVPAIKHDLGSHEVKRNAATA